MTGRQNETAVGTHLADQVRGRRRRQNTILSNDQPCNAVARRDLDDFLNGFCVEIPTIPAHDQSLATATTNSVERGLDKIL